MLLLALDTATSAIAVALHDGERVLAERSVIDPRRTTEVLAPLIHEVLAEAAVGTADLTDIAVGTGPGPFTGLRVGIVTALTLGQVHAIPVHGVCSLDALAAQYASAGADSRFSVATDARRKEVYWACYEIVGERAQRLDDPAVTRPGDLPPDVRELPSVGRGALLYPEHLHHRASTPDGPVLDVSAAALARVALAGIAAGHEMPTTPLYLRRPDAVTPSAPKPTLTPLPPRADRP